MEERIDISVVVPIYGVEKYLRQCLDSLSSQTACNIEFILVDDGGHDGCPAIVDEYAQRDSRFRAVHNENGGYGKAVNSGFALARGDYLGIVEPDDWVDPEMFECLRERAILDDSDLVKSGYVVHHVEKNTEERFLFRETQGAVGIEDAVDLLYQHPSIWTCLYKTRFVRDNGIGFVETRGAGWQDNPFFFQTMILAQRISAVGRAFYHYRVFDAKKTGFLLPLECSRLIEDAVKGLKDVGDAAHDAICVRYILYYRMALLAVGMVALFQNKSLFRRQLVYIDSERVILSASSRFAFNRTLKVHHNLFLDWVAVRINVRMIIRRLFGAKFLGILVKIKRSIKGNV